MQKLAKLQICMSAYGENLPQRDVVRCRGHDLFFHRSSYDGFQNDIILKVFFTVVKITIWRI